MRKISVYGVILTVQHPLKRIEDEYEGFIKSDARNKDTSFSDFLQQVVKGKHEDALRPYADFCGNIDEIE